MLAKLKSFQLRNRINSLLGRGKSAFEPGKVSKLVKKPSFLVGVGLFLALIVGALIYGVWRTQQSPPQPIQFPHYLHLGFGIQCLYCHPGAWKGPSAGLPTETKCWGCHQQITLRNTELNKLVAYVQNQEPIKWVPVFILPDFVYFNHRPHVAAGVACETCHGEVSRMTVVQAPKGLNMGFCLHCHRTRFAYDQAMLTLLTDCGTCHR